MSDVSYWKIAPGQNGFLWDQCREDACILIGWSGVGNLLNYPDKTALAQANAKCNHKKASTDIQWRFAHEIRVGDIVVANKGNHEVVGVGVVTSDYLPPGVPKNPNSHGEYSHARLVDWRVMQTAILPSAFFGQIPQTVQRVYNHRWETIRTSYLAQYPGDTALENALNTLETRAVAPAKPLFIQSMLLPNNIITLLQIAERTDNILLYGPPGTGKTWLVAHFATYFLLSRNVSPAKADEYWQAVTAKDEQIVRALQAEARIGTARYWSIYEDKTAFGWTWDSLAQTGEGFYDDHGIASSPQPPQEGDFVFGYRPGVRQYIALARVTQGLHTREKDGQAVKSIRLGHIVPLAQPVPLALIQADSRIKPPSQLASGMHMPVFALTLDEAATLTKVVETANPTGLPDGFGESFSEFVTFHQSFAYEEFVEGIRPETQSDGSVAYRVRPGVFRRLCERAKQQPKKQFLLIIDEINRANIAKVLGELITLIEDDKRLGQANEVQVTLPYSGERFGVPSNLILLGTMNTADRSIALLDLALRRRFTFIEMPPDPSLLSAEAAGVNLQALLTRLNKRVGALLDPDHRIGHSYLMGVETEADLHFAWYRRIVPLLQEYFYHDGERLQAVLGKAFVMETALDAETKEALGGAYEELARYEVRDLAGEEFLAALQVLAG
jgi:5-methylcytosine-specific restriction protein B